MKYKTTYSTYKTGSIKGFVLGDVETYTPKKVTYIKIRKGDYVRYLGEDGELADEAHAKCFFNGRQANEIVMKMRGDPRYKNYDVRPFETSYIPHRDVEAEKDEASTVCTDVTAQETDSPVVENPVIEKQIEQHSVPERKISSEPAAKRAEDSRTQNAERFRRRQGGGKAKTVVAILLAIACFAVILAVALT